jgi:outer membrane receptor protein involved in Fe transport
MKLFLAFLLLLISTTFFGQNGSISGSVVDEANGNAMPGANVLIRSIKLSTTTDSDGKYVFRNIKGGSYEVEFSFFGYQSKQISEVIVKNNEITYLNTNLVEVKNELKEVVITRTKAKTESIKSLLIAQKNSITVSDGISAETMKRTPDKTTSDVLKRVSGVSIQDNKFVVIRGLNDRYNFASLNGAPLPSSESDRKAFSFDIFPSNMLDNLVITKTASPDMPGEFAGGVISINTKAVPDKNFQSLSYGSGYNTITTFKDQKDYKGSSTDWLGFDNGARALPATIPSKEAFGISPDLAVQQAGLNGKPGAAEIAKTFDTDLSLQDKKFSPNSNFQYAIGHHFDFGEKVFGIVFSLSHSLTNNFNEIARNEWNNGSVGVASVLQKAFNDKSYNQQVLTGSLANFSFKLNQNHSFSFKNILSINSNDLVVDRSGKDDVDDVRILASSIRWFTSNMIYSGQLNGEHYFPQQKIKANWGAFYSDIQRSIPNLRRNLYLIGDPSSSDPVKSTPRAVISGNGGGADFGGGIFYSESSESLAGGKFDLSHKFEIGEDFLNEIKFGSTIQNRNRDFFARQLNYNQSNSNYDNSFELLPDALIFSRENMGLQSSGKNGFTLIDNSAPTDEYGASSDIFASYFMVDNRYKKFRLIWGVRAESFNQKLFSLIVKTDEYPKGEVNINTTKRDFLPSANLIYAVNSKQNLRLSYSRTLNRPEFRELAPFLFYDFKERFNGQGNPNLKRSSILNFDLRYEIFPSKGQLFTVSYFNKKFDSPIEVIQQDLGTPTITYINANKAKVSGVELEFRVLLSSIIKNDYTTLLDDFTLFSNIAVIKSEADVTGIKGTNPEEPLRPLQGQSPYVLNSGLQYMNKDSGLILSANINRSGNRIYIVGSKEKDAIWEKGRTFIDMQVAKSFLKNKLELKLNIQNVLAQDLIFYQNNYRNTVEYGSLETLANHVFTGDFHYQDGYNKADDDIIWLTKFGRSFSLTATYNF